ncbi:hypothetical protein FQA39_LY18593 [Lamprigera yunnana]|nr:hypothetical protein FQA39_LY18593 [Lamprigera yunnana]
MMANTVIKNADLLKALSKLGVKERLALLKCLDEKQIHCICECVYNTLKGEVPLSIEQKHRLSRHKTILRRLVKPGEVIKKKKQILLQHGGGFLPLLLTPLLSAILEKYLESPENTPEYSNKIRKQFELCHKSVKAFDENLENSYEADFDKQFDEYFNARLEIDSLFSRLMLTTSFYGRKNRAERYVALLPPENVSDIGSSSNDKEMDLDSHLEPETLPPLQVIENDSSNDNWCSDDDIPLSNIDSTSSKTTNVKWKKTKEKREVPNYKWAKEDFEHNKPPIDIEYNEPHACRSPSKKAGSGDEPTVVFTRHAHGSVVAEAQYLVMEWTNAKVCELIELYRDRLVLWDCRLKEYKDRNKKQDALQEIADTFGVDKQDQVAGTSKDTPKRGDNENKRFPKKLPGGGPQKIQKTSATEEALSIMRGIQGRHTSGLDQFKTFGELVGLRIKDLPSSNAQKIAKHLISNILFEAEMGKYDHGNPLSGNYSQPFYPIPNYVQQPIPAPMPPNPNPYFEQPSFHGQTSSIHTVTDNNSIDNILMHL